MSIWKWADWIHPVPDADRITLGEGSTPLVHSKRIGPAAGLRNLWFKLEGANPSGSYKDRFAAVAISKMVADGKHSCLATSSGNTGAALAAYCARAGISCRIAIVEGAPQGKLLQMQAYGAQLVRIRGFGANPDVTRQVFDLLERRANQEAAALEISAYRYSPAGMSGVQTISYELSDQLGMAPDHVFCPAGGGGLTLAVARGFELLVAKGNLKQGARIECAQPHGNDTIAGALRAGSDQAHAVTCTTSVSGLQVASIIDGNEVIAACRRSGGTGHLVDDETVYETQRRLRAKRESSASPRQRFLLPQHCRLAVRTISIRDLTSYA